SGSGDRRSGARLPPGGAAWCRTLLDARAAGGRQRRTHRSPRARHYGRTGQADADTHPQTAGRLMTNVEHHRVVIIGAGFGGIGASIKLAAEGVEHVILEKADDVGGTWWANRYPGCRCDVPSHLYSFSFAPNPDWSDSYSLQPEIWRYLRRVAEEHGVIN